MTPFTVLTGIAAPLPIADVDTDKIIPARFMKTVLRSGLGVHLFDPLRYQPDGSEAPDFVLNTGPYRQASILITRENFGCGSSREHAPWALLDFGIRCIIAPSFADIFASNCTKNGILPLTLPSNVCETLLAECADPAQALLVVDLGHQWVRRGNTQIASYAIDEGRRQRLLDGADDIGETLGRESAIARYEAEQRRPATPAIKADLFFSA